MRRDVTIQTRTAVLSQLTQNLVPFTRNPTVGKSPKPHRKVAFILLDHFCMSAFASAFDALIAANLIGEESFYEMRTYGVRSNSALSDLSVELPTDGSLSDLECTPNMLVVVCGGAKNRLIQDDLLTTKLNIAAQKKATFCGIWNGSYYIADAGVTSGQTLAIHESNREVLYSAYPNIPVCSTGYAYTQNVMSSASADTTRDMMLAFIADIHGQEFADLIEEMFTRRVEESANAKSNVASLMAQPGVPEALKESIRLMESNIDDPLNIDELAGFIGISRRQIERLFHRYISVTPSRYYLELRLTRARQLLQQSGLSVSEISTACGFVSTTHFSRSYRRLFGQPPVNTRKIAA